VDVELRAGSAPPVRYPVVELTRGGLFLRSEGPLPKLLSRVRISLGHPTLRARLELAAEIVRQVSADEAAAWRMSPGFAVQFLELAPEARAALAVLETDERRDVVAPRRPATGDERLRLLEGRAGESYYGFLGLAADAEFTEIRRAARALRDELETLRIRPLAADQPARATALLGRLDAAQSALGAPASRLAYDARRGNALGVSRCVAAGVPPALVAARREELLSEHPERRAEASRQLARAQVARKLGNGKAALVAYEAALAADPLDLSTLERYLALRGEVEGRSR
jgi:serine/threonine-protein kinase